MTPIASWHCIDDSLANEALERWEHFLGRCDRPYGRISYGLALEYDVVAVAVSASVPNGQWGPFRRKEVVELARLCAHPDHADLTRVALRLWRKTAAKDWARYWEPIALVSYANAARHTGDIYRFDGWIRLGETRPSNGGGRQKGQRAERKSRWCFPLTNEARERCDEFTQAVAS